MGNFLVGQPLANENSIVPLLPDVLERVDHGTTMLPPVLSWNTGKEALPPRVDGGSTALFILTVKSTVIACGARMSV